METLTVASLIGKAPLFSELDAAALKRIAAGAAAVTAPKGTLLFRHGDPCEGLYVLLSGQVTLSLQTEAGDEKIVELIDPGRSFGEAVAFSGYTQPVSAQALSESTLLHIRKAALQSEIERAPLFARLLVASLSQRLIRLTLMLEGITLRSGTERVVAYLLDQCAEQTADEATVVLAARKGVIASHLNLTQEHFSRVLRELAKQELIEVRGRAVRLINIAALRRRFAR